MTRPRKNDRRTTRGWLAHEPAAAGAGRPWPFDPPATTMTGTTERRKKRSRQKAAKASRKQNRQR